MLSFSVAAFTFAVLAGCGQRGPDSEPAPGSDVGEPQAEQQASTTANHAEGEKMQSMDQLAREYVLLVLSLGNHDDNYVDAYYGPEQLRENARQNTASPAELAEKAMELSGKLEAMPEPADEMEKLRHHYLKTQLRAVAAHAESLTGNGSRDFDREAELLYDTQPPKQAFSEFEPALAELEELLPGEGPLHERVQAFRKQFEIPADKLPAVFEAAIDACRERTRKYIELPANEQFTLEYVTDKPWSGYNWYQGDANSLIQMNTELPVMIDRAIDLGCHEGYPGHHTYNALLEQKLVKDRGWIEFSVYPLFSPQSLIAEGSANYGIELAFPGEEKTQFEREVLYPLADLDPSQAEKYDRVLELIDTVSFAGNTIARQYINGEIDGDRAVELFEKYALMSPEKARQRKRFVDTYGAYVINYNWGKQLVADYIEEGAGSEEERWQRFSRLLSSPRLPSSLNW
ncbi:hypothetical protein AWR36_013915 [Microbulbifer flavimaris]|uniref:DUF885 domain-containing protein n=2 Tax=Microbulbiferaceae TaxID=1706373 RepID=A0ABX4HYY1_9GAMM|nr:hypothetical protein AVO43_13875 [Microbulbifer sp. ZGT114]PCO04534.1 hypothetical protein AWR36_013915 [Microbulbifer flavimaris]